tara:strand:+ start:525 stop:740 length:216 start_codon:yes stop_codon:yes gene_type:complete
MNKHIELVKRWIADKDSVSSQELTDNVDDAVIAAEAASCAVYAAEAAERRSRKIAAHWVKLYEIEIGGLNE